MRIIAPLILALLGGLIGFAVNKVFSRSWLPVQIAIGIGIVAGFAGLIIRDLLDYEFTSDPLFNALFAALISAFVCSLVAHIATLKKNNH